ncbi:Hypothetical predicted protein [Cloeon dipterum]|uniref:C-type lectin domain-containing protein n=1 Tax=Cloeon dipterum TaxID=197152 RepID=A0A8S1C044_9INSE|nr:Hypothetical predicted protein [Cloeon dipterum]
MDIRAMRNILFVLLAVLIVSDVLSARTRKLRSTTKAATKRQRKTTTKKVTTSVTTQSPNHFCRFFNIIQKNFLDLMLPDDFISGKRDVLTEFIDHRGLPFGSYVNRELRIYFESFDTVGFQTAVTTCLYRKLQLLSIDTPKEKNRYSNGLDEMTKVLHFDKTDLDFIWTSAVPCSKSDPLDRATNSCSSVTWCSNNVETRLNYTINLAQASPPYCMAYQFSKQQLVLVNCSFETIFLCEPSCSEPKCPPKSLCKRDDSWFEVVDGKNYLKKDLKIRGKWEQSPYGVSYFLGEKLVTWQENWMTCCSLGLKPIVVTTALKFFDESSSSMQGIVYWTALTRAGCPFHFKNCFHNYESISNLSINGMQEGGSCVAVSTRDPLTKAKMKVSLALKSMVCSSKLLLGCEGQEQTFEFRKDIPIDCDLPECRGIPECVPDESNFIKQPRRVMLAAGRFGNWFSACDHRFLELKKEYGTWDEAYKRCCSLGMDLLSIHNSNKQFCLNNPNAYSSKDKVKLPFVGQYWTSGRDLEACRGRLRWCTSYLNDYLKKDLVWKAQEIPGSANNSCVFVDFNNADFPSLGLADCSEKKQFFCEGPSVVGPKSKVHATFCRKSFKVKEKEAMQIWNNGDISRAGYSAKEMVQCLAEYIGLVYDSTKLNERVYIKMMSRMFFPLDEMAMMQETMMKMTMMNSIQTNMVGSYAVELTPVQSADETKKMKHTLSALALEESDRFYASHFQLAAELISKLYDCRHIMSKTNEATFAFDFLQCILQSEGAERFWTAYNFDLEEFSVIPSEKEVSSPCFLFESLLVNTTFCTPSREFFVQPVPNGPFITSVPIGVKKMKTSSFTTCLEKLGSLPYAKTKEEFNSFYNYFRSVAPNLTIIWDQGFATSDGGFKWCRSDFNPLSSNARISVPVPVVATTTKNPLMLISYPGPIPNLHAVPVTEELNSSELKTNSQVGFKSAVTSCLYRKLHLLSINTPEEIYGYSILGVVSDFMWTSAVPCSKSDPLDRATNSCSSVTWCSNNVETRLDYTLNLAHTSPPYCMVHQSSTQQLVLVNCSFRAMFSCEGTWDEAYKRCCSLGMDLLSIHNSNKQFCLNNPNAYSSKDKVKLPFVGQYWTSGRDFEACRGRLRWCTSFLNDYLKKDLAWKAQEIPGSANNSCVFVDFNKADLPSLGLADCSEKKQFFCEMKSSSFTTCLEKRGSLPYANTKEEFNSFYNYFRGVAPDLKIIWDQGFVTSDGGFKWCRSDVDPLNSSAQISVPVPVVATTTKNPLMLISYPGPTPNLHAVPVTEELKYEVDVFCRFETSIVEDCSSVPTDKPILRWEY